MRGPEEERACGVAFCMYGVNVGRKKDNRNAKAY
jgi:hypothetical protein